MTETPSPPSTPASPSATIAVPRWLVWGAGGALVVCLLSLGYFVGRDSARPETETETAPAPARTTSPPRSTPSPAPAERLSATAPANPQREAVGGGGLSADDPEQLAMAILSQATTGDATAFDQLADAQESSLAALRRVQPPAAYRHLEHPSSSDAGALSHVLPAPRLRRWPRTARRRSAATRGTAGR